MQDLTEKMGLYQPPIFDQTDFPKERTRRFFYELHVMTKELEVLLEEKENLLEFLNQLETAVDAIYKELSRTFWLRKIVFTGWSGQFTQKILLKSTKNTQQYPEVASRIKNALLIDGNHNKRIKYQLGFTTLLPPLSIVIDDYAKSFNKATTYLPELFLARSMFVLFLPDKKDLTETARFDLQRLRVEGRFKFGCMNTKACQIMEKITKLVSDVENINKEGEYYASVQMIEYKWDKSKLTPEQLEILKHAQITLQTLTEIIKLFFNKEP
jgi:hypothetical protein